MGLLALLLSMKMEGETVLPETASMNYDVLLKLSQMARCLQEAGELSKADEIAMTCRVLASTKLANRTSEAELQSLEWCNSVLANVA